MRKKIHCSRLFLVCALALPIFCCSRGGPVVEAGDTTVSPEGRLADYIEFSRFPDTSRPARTDTPELDGLIATGKSAASSAEILAWDGEELRGGSLVVFLRVRALEPGRFSFRAVLVDADGKKIALATETRDLSAGIHRIGLPFYGLIFHESKWKSPFALAGAAGERLPTDADLTQAVRPDGSVKPPPEGRLTSFRVPYKTKTYNAGDFTKREWDSPEKAARIRALNEEIAAQKKR